MTSPRPQHRRPRRLARGYSLPAALVGVLLVTLLSAVLMRGLVGELRQLRTYEHRLQGAFVAEVAERVALARAAAGAAPEDFHLTHAELALPEPVDVAVQFVAGVDGEPTLAVSVRFHGAASAPYRWERPWAPADHSPAPLQE